MLEQSPLFPQAGQGLFALFNKFAKSPWLYRGAPNNVEKPI